MKDNEEKLWEEIVKLREQWADGYISTEELYAKLMAIRKYIDSTIEHALNWGDEE